MDIEKEIREEWHKSFAVSATAGRLCKVTDGNMHVTNAEEVADWWITRLHTLLERQREGIRAEIEEKRACYNKESHENVEQNNIMIAYDMDSRCVAAKQILSIPSLQPTLKDNPQKE